MKDLLGRLSSIRKLEKVQMTVYLPKCWIKTLKAIAVHEDVKVNDIMVHLVREFLTGRGI